MDSQIAITCFADLKGSTAMTEDLGQDGFRPFRQEYLKIGKTLADNTGGKYIKNIGDAHMVTFQDIEKAFRFAAQLQQFYQPQPNYLKAPLSSRIGLFLGVIEPDGDDVFGPGVNQAARVEGKSTPGAIWLNNELVEAVSKIWGESKTNHLFNIEGEFELKGIKEKQNLHSFNWQEYIKKNPKDSLSELVYRQFQDASVILSNLNLEDFANQAPIIWPVVPRDGVNAIHCGQLEIIRLLAMLGSRVHVLIADCGATNNQPREYSENFKNMIDRYASRRNLRDIAYTYMNDLFTPRCEGCDELHGIFQSVISQLTLENLLDINHKDYANDVQAAIREAPTLEFLHPALTLSSVILLSKRIGEKCVVVAGYDENIQWAKSHSFIPATRDQYGALFNPVLKEKEGLHQGRQTKNWPIYFSSQEIVDDMARYDLAKWLTQLHLFLSSFPAAEVEVEGVSFYPKDWIEKDMVEDKIHKNGLAQRVFTEFFAR